MNEIEVLRSRSQQSSEAVQTQMEAKWAQREVEFQESLHYTKVHLVDLGFL